MDKKTDTQVPIGIDGIAFSIPRGYVSLTDLAEARGVPASKYLNGLGTHAMAVAGPEEDPVTLAVNAARRLFQRSGRSPAEIGLCIVGTETAVDHSKPIAAFVHGQLGLPSACRSYETKHACFGGTAGLMTALDWIAAGTARGAKNAAPRVALIICSDIARYPLGSAGEPTQGAGAVAFIVSERPRLVELEVARTGSYTRDVHDFWRPLDRKDALTDGHFSVQCYLDALAGAYQSWQQVAGGGAELVRTCYHVPYGKMARKAHRHRKQLDGLTEAAADASFAVEVESSLDLPAQVGNIYTGSLYLALASLLQHDAAAIVGQRIGLFSYGSGCTAEFFAGRVHEDAPAMVNRLRMLEPLQERERLSIPAYEALRQGDLSSDKRPAPAGALATGIAENLRSAAVGVAGHSVFLGVDPGERRVYSAS